MNLLSLARLTICVFVCSQIILACTDYTPQKEWKLVYHHDDQGHPIYGNKHDLIDAVRSGYPIRIWYGRHRSNDRTKSIEHVADAKFLTITNGKEVFAQIDPIVAQQPNLDTDSLSVRLRENMLWTICVGSNGYSDRVMFERNSDSTLGHNNRAIELKWFTNGSSKRTNQ